MEVNTAPHPGEATALLHGWLEIIIRIPKGDCHALFFTENVTEGNEKKNSFLTSLSLSGGDFGFLAAVADSRWQICPIVGRALADLRSFLLLFSSQQLGLECLGMT